METYSIGKEKAIELFDSGWWKDKSEKDVAMFQFHIDELCLPFGEFHRCVEKALGRPVFTHEFGMNRDGLISELLGESKVPTMEEIIGLIPSDKLMVVVV